MEYEFFLEKFQKSADQLDKDLLAEKHIKLYVGIYVDSVVLKLYENH